MGKGEGRSQHQLNYIKKQTKKVEQSHFQHWGAHPHTFHILHPCTPKWWFCTGIWHSVNFANSLVFGPGTIVTVTPCEYKTFQPTPTPTWVCIIYCLDFFSDLDLFLKKNSRCNASPSLAGFLYKVFPCVVAWITPIHWCSLKLSKWV